MSCQTCVHIRISKYTLYETDFQCTRILTINIYKQCNLLQLCRWHTQDNFSVYLLFHFYYNGNFCTSSLVFFNYIFCNSFPRCKEKAAAGKTITTTTAHKKLQWKYKKSFSHKQQQQKQQRSFIYIILYVIGMIFLLSVCICVSSFLFSPNFLHYFLIFL